jgi:F1F0 ATPase subunit 2
MNDTQLRILALPGGMVLGVFFFGGLWLTVKKTVTSKKMVLLFVGSSILRTCITLAGLYFISHGNWQRLLIAMIGFIAARFVVMRMTKSSAP